MKIKLSDTDFKAIKDASKLAKLRGKKISAIEIFFESNDKHEKPPHLADGML